jgi:hypothetical protein
MVAHTTDERVVVIDVKVGVPAAVTLSACANPARLARTINDSPVGAANMLIIVMVPAAEELKKAKRLPRCDQPEVPLIINRFTSP